MCTIVDMKVFSGSSNKPLAEKISQILKTKVYPVEHHIFPDGEQRVMLSETVVGDSTVVVQSMNTPVDQNFVELLLLIDALKRNGSSEVIVIVPYLGYQRQDHVFRSGEARSLEVVIRSMEAVGADKFVLVDPHSIKIPELFHRSVVHLSAISIFAAEIKKLGFLSSDTVLVSPDMGGVRRIAQLSKLLSDMPYASVEKNRDLVSGDVEASVIHGDLAKNAIIVDDMISSGGTIKTAAELLSQKGVQRIVVMATHAIFAKEAPEILQNTRAEKVYVSDSVYVPEEKRFDKLVVLSLASDIAECI